MIYLSDILNGGRQLESGLMLQEAHAIIPRLLIEYVENTESYKDKLVAKVLMQEVSKALDLAYRFNCSVTRDKYHIDEKKRIFHLVGLNYDSVVSLLEPENEEERKRKRDYKYFVGASDRLDGIASNFTKKQIDVKPDWYIISSI